MGEARERFIEEVGLAAEADGLPRIAGRLFGHLLLSPGPCTLDEIADALDVSKGSVSTDARLLLRHGWLRRTSRVGDRKDYYEMAPDFFAGIVAYRLERWDALHDLVAAAIPDWIGVGHDDLQKPSLVDTLPRLQPWVILLFLDTFTTPLTRALGARIAFHHPNIAGPSSYLHQYHSRQSFPILQKIPEIRWRAISSNA